MSYPKKSELEKAIKDYIKAYIRKHKNIKKLLPYFEEDKLNKVQTRIQLLDGEAV